MIRVSELSKELGTSNKVLVGFLAEKYPDFGVTDYKKHHGKAISDIYKDDICKNFEEYLKANPELAEDTGTSRTKKKTTSTATTKRTTTPKKATTSKKTATSKKTTHAEKPADEPKDVPAEKPAASENEEADNGKNKPAAPAPVVPPPVAVVKPAPIPPAPPTVPPIPRAPAPVVAPKAPVAPPPIPAVPPARPTPVVPPPVAVAKLAPIPPVPPPIPPITRTASGEPKTPAAPPPIPPVPVAKSAPAVPVLPAGNIPAKQNSAEPVSQTDATTDSPVATEPRKKLSLRAPVVVRDLANALEIRPFRILSELMNMGIFASLNQDVKDEIAIKIADNHGVDLDVKHREKGASQQVAKPVQEVKKPVDDEKDKEPRCPVVCVLGHVDHGKTTLLDFYRKSNVTAGEAGGITQHVGAYTVVHNGQRITFLDTPGHAAFSKMRERGAALTDIAVLVVAADDGFMPQTDEALKFAQKNNVQLVVAINKCDAKGANIDRVKQQMQKRGITSEDWGGTVQCEAVSALKGTNMDALLDAILLQAEMMELKANPKCPAEGTVVEAQMEQGRGPTATVIVQRGTLKVGDVFVCAQHFCRVRAILDEYGKPLKSIAPGNPGRVLGWSGVPSAGAVFTVVKNAREAEKIAEENKYKLRKAEEAEEEEANAAEAAAQKNMSSMDLLNSLLKESNEKVFKCVLKADVDGTLEALEGELLSIKSKRVKIEIVGGSVGPITPGDVNTASAANATIVAFDVKQENSVPALLKRVGVKVISHNIIYMLLGMVKEAMAEMLDPEYKENAVGEAEVRAIFPLGKNSNVAGSMVVDGSIRRDFNARVVRKGEVLHTGKIDTLKRFKDDVTEVKSGYECGIRVTGFDEYQKGDRIECFEILEVRPAL